jgi:hypothetical protein
MLTFQYGQYCRVVNIVAVSFWLLYLTPIINVFSKRKRNFNNLRMQCGVSIKKMILWENALMKEMADETNYENEKSDARVE